MVEGDEVVSGLPVAYLIQAVEIEFAVPVSVPTRHHVRLVGRHERHCRLDALASERRRKESEYLYSRREDRRVGGGREQANCSPGFRVLEPNFC